MLVLPSRSTCTRQVRMQNVPHCLCNTHHARCCFFLISFKLELDAYLRRRFESAIARVDTVQKEDMDLLNHLSGLQRTYLKLSFHTVHALLGVRNELQPIVAQNQVRCCHIERAVEASVLTTDIDVCLASPNRFT